MLVQFFNFFEKSVEHISVFYDSIIKWEIGKEDKKENKSIFDGLKV
jgi:hypothetical protein